MSVKPLDIVIMAGQSNMVGYNTQLGDIAKRWHNPIADAQVWQDGKWKPLRACGGYQKSGFGPELSFAHQYARPGRRLGIVKLATTGSFLSKHWHPDINGGLFDQLVEKVAKAQLAEPCRLAGFLWVQGEADAYEEDSADAYSASFKLLVERLRARLAAPELPVLAAAVNPPEHAFPNLYKVIDGLSQPGIDNRHVISCEGLPKQRDSLHYDVRGLSKLGRRFSDTLIAHQEKTEGAPGPQVREMIYSSANYDCWYEGPQEKKGAFVVTFPYAIVGDGLLEPGFGQAYFSRKNMPAIYIRSRESNWFQTQEVFEVARKIRAFTGSKARIVTYGASMGAYGALIMSGALNAFRVLAIAPQFSIDRRVVAFETRWARAARKIGEFMHTTGPLVSEDAEKIIVYDNLSMDRKQVEMFETDESWSLLPMPFASHQMLRFLQESGALGRLLDGLFDEGPELVALRQAAREGRRNSAIYWMTMASETAAKFPQIASNALEQAARLGAPRRKIRGLQAALNL